LQQSLYLTLLQASHLGLTNPLAKDGLSKPVRVLRCHTLSAEHFRISRRSELLPTLHTSCLTALLLWWGVVSFPSYPSGHPGTLLLFQKTVCCFNPPEETICSIAPMFLLFSGISQFFISIHFPKAPIATHIPFCKLKQAVFADYEFQPILSCSEQRFNSCPFVWASFTSYYGKVSQSKLNDFCLSLVRQLSVLCIIRFYAVIQFCYFHHETIWILRLTSMVASLFTVRIDSYGRLAAPYLFLLLVKISFLSFNFQSALCFPTL